MRSTPVTLISGFSSSGKSSLVQHLRKSKNTRLAIIEDDGEKDLFLEIDEAAQMQAADAIVIECAPNLEPFFIAEHLVEGDEENPPAQGVHVDTLVTVVDAANALKDLYGASPLQDRELAFDEEDDRSVAELMIEQIEFADVLILNKIDLVSRERADELESLLSRLNPRAKVLRAEYGRVDASEIVGTGAFELAAWSVQKATCGLPLDTRRSAFGRSRAARRSSRTGGCGLPQLRCASGRLTNASAWRSCKTGWRRLATVGKRLRSSAFA
jgi:G3E family GTPase